MTAHQDALRASVSLRETEGKTTEDTTAGTSDRTTFAATQRGSNAVGDQEAVMEVLAEVRAEVRASNDALRRAAEEWRAGRGDAMTGAITESAVGALTAQATIEELNDDLAPQDMAWLRCCDLAARHGWTSAAVRAFVLELAKRASR